MTEAGMITTAAGNEKHRVVEVVEITTVAVDPQPEGRTPTLRGVRSGAWVAPDRAVPSPGEVVNDSVQDDPWFWQAYCVPPPTWLAQSVGESAYVVTFSTGLSVNIRGDAVTEHVAVLDAAFGPKIELIDEEELEVLLSASPGSQPPRTRPITVVGIIALLVAIGRGGRKILAAGEQPPADQVRNCDGAR